MTYPPAKIAIRRDPRGMTNMVSRARRAGWPLPYTAQPVEHLHLQKPFDRIARDSCDMESTDAYASHTLGPACCDSPVEYSRAVRRPTSQKRHGLSPFAGCLPSHFWSNGLMGYVEPRKGSRASPRRMQAPARKVCERWPRSPAIGWVIGFPSTHRAVPRPTKNPTEKTVGRPQVFLIECVMYLIT